jgi:hypothetical protein
VTASENSPPGPPEDRDSLYDGIGGLALALGEIKLAREWTEDERTLADGIVSRLSVADAGGECGLYVGLAGSLVAVAILAPTASTGLLGRLANFATPTGWPSSIFDDPASPINDLIMGNAGVVLACAWLGGERADRLAALGADALVASAISAPHGLAWKMYEGDRDRVMPTIPTELRASPRHLRLPGTVFAGQTWWRSHDSAQNTWSLWLTSTTLASVSRSRCHHPMTGSPTPTAGVMVRQEPRIYSERWLWPGSRPLPGVRARNGWTGRLAVFRPAVCPPASDLAFGTMTGDAVAPQVCWTQL